VTYESPLKSRWWLLVPMSGFLAAILVLVGVGARGWWRSSRALKHYKSKYR
jgi:hypothetical protein